MQHYLAWIFLVEVIFRVYFYLIFLVHKWSNGMVHSKKICSYHQAWEVKWSNTSLYNFTIQDSIPAKVSNSRCCYLCYCANVTCLNKNFKLLNNHRLFLALLFWFLLTNFLGFFFFVHYLIFSRIFTSKTLCSSCIFTS